MEGWVHFTEENGIGTVEFGHPQSNALPSQVLDLLAKTLQKASEDDNVKVIILKSSGHKTFCAGASFDELTRIQNNAEGLRFFSGFAKVINACREKPWVEGLALHRPLIYAMQAMKLQLNYRNWPLVLVHLWLVRRLNEKLDFPQ